VRRILYLSILVATCAWADDTSDREAVERVIAAVNNHSRSLSDLFTTDAPENEQVMLSANEQPWSEVTSPRITARSIRMISPQIALVECTNTQYGSAIIVQNTSMLLVMKKDGEQWRIACVQPLPAAAAKPSSDH
jgi:hypothetical protein